MIENPHGGKEILKDIAVTNRGKGAEKLKPEDITQIQPQKLNLTLRSGEDILFWTPILSFPFVSIRYLPLWHLVVFFYFS